MASILGHQNEGLGVVQARSVKVCDERFVLHARGDR